MKCATSATDLWLLAAGELPDADAERLTLHVASCAVCNERLVNASALFRETGVDLVRPVAPPPDLKAELMARVAATQARRPRWAALAAAAGLAGALLGSAVAGWVAWERFVPAEEKLRFELALVHETGRKHGRRLQPQIPPGDIGQPDRSDPQEHLQRRNQPFAARQSDGQKQ